MIVNKNDNKKIEKEDAISESQMKKNEVDEMSKDTQARTSLAYKLEPKRFFIIAAIVLVATYLITLVLPDDPANLGVLKLLPAIFLIGYIFWTKRILEAIILATILAFVMVHKGGWFGAFNESLLEVMMSEDVAWLFIVCGLIGSIIMLIEKAGGAWAFGEWVSKRAKTEKSTLIWTWILGVAIFIDDYLNSLTVGSCMSPVTDRHNVSREKLAYIVDSTAAPACVIVPITTWAIFASRLMEANGWAPEGEGMVYFIKTIPYNFYAWIALIVVPLVVIGVIPIFGPMKEAERRAKEDGILAPPGSEKIDIRGGQKVEVPDDPKIMNFFLPILFLLASTIYFEVDMMMGVVTTVGFMFFLYVPQNLMTAEEFADHCVEGIKNMIMPLLLVVLVFTFGAANEQVGFVSYVIESTRPFMTPEFMPLIVFLVLGATEFITGTSWGMYIIAFPIVITLSMEIGANVALTSAAVLSAGVFGSHICFYSDATILTSTACGCDNYRHAITQMPFGFLGASISAVLFLAAGFIF
jgi:Na+/H+ antiporter NhaC